jgi:Transposase DDE domain
LSKLITFILSISSSGKGKSVDTKSGEFFRAARRSGLWPKAEAVHRSGVTRARKKLPWPVFRDILRKAVELAYSLWPQGLCYLWSEMSVYAIDSSKYTLPASDELRSEFDPKSGIFQSGKGHYPECRVTTAYDVFRRFPVALSVVKADSSEREEAKAVLPFIPPDSVVLFDRGYPSYGLILHLNQSYKGYFIFRCPAQSTFPAVESFLKGRQLEGYVFISPSDKYLARIPRCQREEAKAIRLRVVRVVSPDGTVSVLLTNLFNRRKFHKRDIVKLYFRRWEVELFYRDEKTMLEVEKFHGRTTNGIYQEIYAAAIMTVIARSLMIIASQTKESITAEYQLKNAIMALASEVAVLARDDPQKVAQIFTEIIEEISRVKYYRPKSPRPSPPRVTKAAPNRWCYEKRKKLAAAP